MSGIPIHTEDAINAAKPNGITPRTAAPPVQSTPLAPQPNAESPVTYTNSDAYPAARPGAAPGPAPTGSVQQNVAKAPLPTATPTKVFSQTPPPPQPGAFPIPQASSQAPKSALPPPPKPGEAASARAQTGSSQVEPSSLPQITPQHPPLTSPPSVISTPQASRSITSSSTRRASYIQPGSLPFAPSTPTRTDPAATGGQRRQSLVHPPGYVQNPRAADLTPDQRSANEASNDSTPLGGLLGGGDGPRQSVFNLDGEDGDGIWDTAKKWAKTAGEKVSEAEHEVWKRLNSNE
ncbi:MAG: hypothetical protein M1837_006141 [Sclerophora amabilis]|nr:MAG: hypothetical protein M1837_006141 [Sclerophora amabilis]